MKQGPERNWISGEEEGRRRKSGSFWLSLVRGLVRLTWFATIPPLPPAIVVLFRRVIVRGGTRQTCSLSGARVCLARSTILTPSAKLLTTRMGRGCGRGDSKFGHRASGTGQQGIRGTFYAAGDHAARASHHPRPICQVGQHWAGLVHAELELSLHLPSPAKSAEQMNTGTISLPLSLCLSYCAYALPEYSEQNMAQKESSE